MVTLDDLDWELLRLLQEDARLGYRELARHVGLSAPAVASRVRRLERHGVITGYSARVDPLAAGYAVEAFIHIESSGKRQSYGVAAQAIADPYVLEDHRVAGQDDHILRVVAETVRDLEPFIDSLHDKGSSATSFIFSSPKRWAPVVQPGTLKPESPDNRPSD
ncbi:Lrp/AsnC family transcriptional regulator [Arthrobacter sp. NA-172]|uniref:Lrp/AsnC family transcriptional regulator n=1 Tax=Arthrobacter sp. NA-172 TaxID=3367524 RepID=UPI0037550D67